jgi:hypothetical protein
MPLILLAWSGSVAPTAAQEVRGRLLESGTGTPVMLGTVALLDTTMTVVYRTITNEKGAFVLNAPRPGDYYVVASRMGYTPKLDGILELGKGGLITIDFYLRPQPVVLDSLRVSVSRQRIDRYLNDQGFYDRMKQGFGNYLTPESIEKRPAIDEADLLRRVPFVRVDNQGFPGNAVYLLNRGRSCTPEFYVNGARASFAPGMAGVVSDLVKVEDIIAVEVYRGETQIPLQWASFNSCGVVLVWTRYGQARK